MIVIAFVINNLKKNGAETMLCNFLQKFAPGNSKQFKIHLILLNNDNDTFNFNLVNKLNIHIHILSEGKLLSFSLFLKLQKLLKIIRPNIVHVHLFPSFYYVALLKIFRIISAKTVLTEHTTKNNRFQYFLLRYIDRYLYNSYDKIICVSNSVRNYLYNYYNFDQIIIINNGIDLYVPNKNNQRKYDFEFNLNSLVFKIMMVARFETGKDFTTLIKALSLLSDFNIKLLLVGVGDLQSCIVDLVSKFNLQDKVLFLGVRNDVRDLMNYVDLNILSSEFEGFSGVALESVFASKPFIGTDVPGITDVINDDSMLFNVGDYIQLADLIQNVINDNEVRIRNIELNSKAIELFTLDQMVIKHNNIYFNYI